MQHEGPWLRHKTYVVPLWPVWPHLLSPGTSAPLAEQPRRYREFLGPEHSQVLVRLGLGVLLVRLVVPLVRLVVLRVVVLLVRLVAWLHEDGSISN
jgi:hypothetical protein